MGRGKFLLLPLDCLDGPRRKVLPPVPPMLDHDVLEPPDLLEVHWLGTELITAGLLREPLLGARGPVIRDCLPCRVASPEEHVLQRREPRLEQFGRVRTT